MTSCPSRTRRAAATELSTPPDIATRTRLRTAEHRGELADLLDHLGEDLRDPRDVGGGALVPEGETKSAQREIARDAHRRHHVRRLHRSGGTRAAARGTDPLKVEVHQESFAVRARDREAEDMRGVRRSGGVSDQVRDTSREAAPKIVAQALKVARRLGLF